MPPGLLPSAPLRSARFYAAVRGVRHISKSPTQSSTVGLPVHAPILPPSPLSHNQHNGRHSSLSMLPLNNILRTYLITAMSSSPVMLNTCLSMLSRMMNSKSQLLDPEKNQYLGWLFKKTFYDQFCAGQNQTEVEKTSTAVKGLGYQGIILEYCLEVLEREFEETDGNDPTTLSEIETWRKGMNETLAMAHPRDYVALKWSGLGSYALKLLKNDLPPTPAMEKAIKEICDIAYEKQVRLLPGAEWEQTNLGIHSWTLNLQRQYNRSPSKGAIMYNTYQAYLKSTPGKVAKHLAVAKKEGFTPGIKLVRGAYLSTEPRHLIWDTKDETDKCYDDVMEALMRKRYSGLLLPAEDQASDKMPKVELLLATHNHQSVRKAQAIRHEQQQDYLTSEKYIEEPIPLAFAQLYGMADDLSCEIVETLKEQGRQTGMWPGSASGQPEAIKSISWGTLNQCLHFLSRRANENKDAVGRTAETRKAMQVELWRRMTRPFRWTTI